MRERLAETRQLPYTISARFVSGLSYMAASASSEDATVQPLTRPTQNISSAMASEELELRKLYLSLTAGCIFVTSVRYALASTSNPNGGLHKLLADYYPALEEEVSTSGRASTSEEEHAAEITNNHNTGEDVQAARVLAQSSAIAADNLLEGHEDDDSDWEPLEQAGTLQQDQVSESTLLFADLSFQSELPNKSCWEDSLHKLAKFASFARRTVSSSKAWADLHLADDVLEIVRRLLSVASQDVDVRLALRPYVELLGVYLMTSGILSREVETTVVRFMEATAVNLSNSLPLLCAHFVSYFRAYDSCVPCVVPGAFQVGLPRVIGLTPAGAQQGDELAYLLLETLCSQHQLKGHSSLHMKPAVQLLWPSLQAALPYLSRKLEAILSTWQSSVENECKLNTLIHMLLTFLEVAPVKAQAGSQLVEVGVCRLLAPLLGADMMQPTMEPLQMLVLLGVTASPDFTAYMRALPPFCSFLVTLHKAEAELPDAVSATHRLMWPLVLHARGLAYPSLDNMLLGMAQDAAELPLASSLSRLSSQVKGIGTPDLDLTGLTLSLRTRSQALLLLVKVVTMARSASARLWAAGGPLALALTECYAAVASAMTTKTQEQDTKASQQDAELARTADEAGSSSQEDGDEEAANGYTGEKDKSKGRREGDRGVEGEKLQRLLKLLVVQLKQLMLHTSNSPLTLKKD
eukprot:SM000243S08586  [mRNA]  locus=s243:68551:72225:- [translate_table: standard]